MRYVGLVALSMAVVLVAMLPATIVPAAQQSQCFNETGYCIDDPAFQSYFGNRGGARILGFPVSRTFRLEGFNVQFFQRVVLQNQGGNVARLNLLDPGDLARNPRQSVEFSRARPWPRRRRAATG